ncbi:MAG: helix-turn-helix domain-containing protein [Chloroflexi bacterium]|nr:helix-turn-helix domain-containing protein [Chloroflexota bacterium]
MPATQATTVQQREKMVRLADQGETYQSVADQTGVSYWTARKWIRQARRGGLAALVTTYGRPDTGPMSGFDPLVRYVALRRKRQHKTWGAEYVVKKMGEHPLLKGKKLPSPTTVWRYWRSFGDHLFPKRRPARPKQPPAGVAHGMWQMDAKESVPIAGVGVVTFNQAHDDFGRATVMHRIHPTEQPEQRIVKLTTAQVQQDCRIAFTEWGLPDAIQTDQASIFVDADPTPFPTQLTLWWVGLGIKHHLVSSPMRNGCIERGQRTLDERTLVDQRFDDADELQKQVDADWYELNAECPSRAKGCDGQPPLVAHPELLVPRRSYRPEWELDLFDLKRVDNHLATLTWIRTVSEVGQVSLGSRHYGLGTAWAGQTVAISFDPEQRQFVFTQVKPKTKRGQRQPKLPPVCLNAKGLSVEWITGLPVALGDLPMRQLMLPLSMCCPQPVSQGV